MVFILQAAPTTINIVEYNKGGFHIVIALSIFFKHENHSFLIEML